ncbi:MAG: GH92 family glycosyl hydrolase [Luteolibacter sp.]|uniref:GH92 family glycosyl hydrolase n=1 Tax=Luteolibacter sp. TaxID=1962973 RepID=UPI00326797A5
MSLRLSAAVAAACFFSWVSAPAATLRHHYELDSGGGDALGAANLTVQGNSVVFNSSGGAAGGYVRLGGSDDYLLASLDGGSTFSLLGSFSTFRPFSISFWVRQTPAQSTSSTHAVFGMTTGSTDSATYNTGFEVITRESSAGRGLRVRARQGGSGNNAGEISTGYDVCDGNWHHVVAVYESSSRSVYVDGIFRGENTIPVAITTNPIKYFAIGAFLRAGSILDDFNGDVDDLQVYEGAVTAAEALQLFQNPGTTIETIPPTTNLAPINLVDPLIGAEGTGGCVPGACLPQSSIYPSPDTLAVSPSGYKAGSAVVGFAQLHAQGAGASTPSFGNFLVSPRLGAGINESDHASPVYGVTARPYSYRARLTGWNTDCAVVPTANSTIYQFDFPASTDARLSFDVARKLGRADGMTSGSVTIDTEAGTISGGGTFDGNWNPAAYNVYFYAKVDTTPMSGGTWIGSTSSTGVLSASTVTRQRLGGWMRFDTTASRKVMLKIAVSFVSVEQARAHLEQEIPAWDLTGLEAQAKARWVDALSVLTTPGVSNEEGRKLYTSLFHSLVQPRDRTSDSPGWPAGTPFWDDQYTLWDTWQTLYPLLAIVKPAAVAANVNSFAERFARNGRAETAFIQGKDFASGQGGDEVDLVIADAHAKQIPGIDWEKVWPLLQFNAGRRTADYRNLGYVSYDGSIGGYDGRMKSGSSTLAFAYGDWCAAQVGLAHGHAAEAQALLVRSSNWKNVWDASASGDGFSGFVRARNRDGSFRSTAAIAGNGTDFYQGTCWNYSFNVPHDREAMIGLMGGRARFIERLNHALGKNDSNYIDFTNEPSFQPIWQFCHTGRPYLASYYADQLRQRFGAYSFPGDEDSGAMSSLYFFLTAGFFPSSGQDHYYLHGPRVPRLEFRISNEKTFSVIAENSGGANIYVQSATLNGQPLDTPIIHHSDILAGSTLSFVMGPSPTAWGTGQDFQPPPAHELVIPARGVWTGGLGTPQITAPATDSPVWENTSATAIHSPFPQVTLEDSGDSITLSAEATFLGLSASPGSERFAWGLFSTLSASNTPGYLATNDSTASFWRKTTGAYSTTVGASTLATTGFVPPAFTDGNYRLLLTLTRTADGGLDYYAALIRVSDGVLFSAFTGSDPSPSTFSFDRVGLRCGSTPTSISLRHTTITVRRADYTGKNLTIPPGSTFFPTDLAASLASITNYGTLDLITSSVPLPSNFINFGTVLGITSVDLVCSAVGDDLAFSLNGHPGHTYQLQQDIGGKLNGPWENVGEPLLGDGAILSLVILGAGAKSSAFFRIKVE